MRFLANIDEVDTARAIAQLDAAETLVVVTSKSFGTRETLINACTLRQWLIEELGSGEGGVSPAEITAKHIAACTCAPCPVSHPKGRASRGASSGARDALSKAAARESP